MTGWTLVTATTNYLGVPVNVGADDAGNAYVMLVGYANGGVLDLRRFGPDGYFVWRFNTDPTPTTGYLLSSTAPVVSPSGEVFIAGRVLVHPSPSERSEGNFIARLNPTDGTFLWVKNLSNVSTGQSDLAGIRLLNLDGSGHVRVLAVDNLGGNRSVRTFAFDGTEAPTVNLSFLPAVQDGGNARYALDRSGGIYFYANRIEALKLGPTNFPALGGTGAQSYILARYDATGAFQWLRAFTGPGAVVNTPALNVDASGNLIIAGALSLNNAQTFQIGTNILTGSGYAAKVTPAGEIAWAKAWSLNIRDAALGTDGSVYLAGWFRFAPTTSGGVTRQIPFGTTHVAGSSVTGHDLFVAKLSPEGEEQFIRQSGGPEFATEDNAVSYSIAVDSRGVVTTAGYTRVPHPGGGLDFGDLRYLWPNLVPFDIANSGGDLPCYYVARLEVDTVAAAPPVITFTPPAPGASTLRLNWPAGYQLQRQTAILGGVWETLHVAAPYDANLAEFAQGFFRVVPGP